MNQTDRTYVRRDGPKRRRRTRRDHREGGFTQWAKGYHPGRERRAALAPTVNRQAREHGLAI